MSFISESTAFAVVLALILAYMALGIYVQLILCEGGC